jgi:UDP:flavonoid glycosyltransferase YjiC (YdhE family)
MKFAIASYGTRGDVEPCVAVGRELLRRGHEVRIAVPPDLVDFAQSAGLAATAYGPNTHSWLDAYRNFYTCWYRTPWRIRNLVALWREVRDRQPITQCWEETSTTLTSLTDGADVLLTDLGSEDAAANVAEYYDIPLATLHWIPVRPNGQILSFLPSRLGRSAMSAYQWLGWRVGKKHYDAQRRKLGLPKTTAPSSRRITRRGSLEIQAYDEVCFPGLAAEWAKFDGQRPFVGALTLELPTDADDEVAEWIAAGKPPIFFGFGSIPVESGADMLAMLSAACAQLGERALICSAGTDFGDVANVEHVKVVGTLNYAAAFPACRAVVHHGGAGTTAAGLRAGVPTLSLWREPDQRLWATQVKRLQVGTSRHFASMTQQTLVADLCTILAPEYVARAREIAARMTKTTDSAAMAAELVERFACLGRVG